MTCTTVDRELLLYVLERCRASFVEQDHTFSYTSDDLAPKNAKLTMKLSAALGRCGNTLTVSSSLN